MKLSPSFRLADFIALFTNDAGLVAVDWLLEEWENRRCSDADVCLLFARDAEACEGLVDWFEVTNTNSPYRQIIPGLSVEPVLSLSFPLPTFAAWAGARFGEEVGRKCRKYSLKNFDPPYESQWCVRDEIGPVLEPATYSRSTACRRLRRRVLACVPVSVVSARMDEASNRAVVKTVQAAEFVPAEPITFEDFDAITGPQVVAAMEADGLALRAVSRPG